MEGKGKARLPSASVLVMAQSVGAILTEEVADNLGQLALGRLKTALLLATEFADQENAKGLETIHFTHAEKVLNTPSYGNRSKLPEPDLRVQDSFSFYEEGPQFDIRATLASKRTSTLEVKQLDPEFQVEDILINCPFGNDDDDDEEVEEEEEVNITENNLNSNTPNGNSNGEITQEDVEHEEVPMEENVYLDDGEWKSYLEMFISIFLNKPLYISEVGSKPDADGIPETETQLSNTAEFEIIVNDLREHSALPVADVICEFLENYIKGRFVDPEGVREPVTRVGLLRVVRVVQAFLVCLQIPPSKLLQKMSCILIELLLRPAGFHVQNHPSFIQAVLTISEKHEDLLTWISVYVAQVFKRTLEIPQTNLTDKDKCVLHGALVLVIGLNGREPVPENGWEWDSSTITNLYNHVKNNSDNQSESDKHLLEQFEKFESCQNGHQG